MVSLSKPVCLVTNILNQVHVAALAKRHETLYSRDFPEGLELEPDSAALYLVQNVRDEAHRFAQRYHHKLREKRFTGSILEEAPGIGPKRRAALLDNFGSFEGVKSATVEELAQVESMTANSAKALRNWLDTEGT